MGKKIQCSLLGCCCCSSTFRTVSGSTFVCATHLIIPLRHYRNLDDFSMFDFRTKRDGDSIVEVIKDGVLIKKTVNGHEQPLGSLPSGSSGRKIKNK